MADDNSLPDLERRTFLKATGAAGAAAAFSGITAATPSRDPGPKRNEYLAVISDAYRMQEAQSSIQAEIENEPAQVNHFNNTLNFIAIEIDQDLTEIAQMAIKRRIENQTGVRKVEANSTHYPMSTPNDPRFEGQYAPQQVDAPTAWDTDDGSDATVAVVDQGVKYDHPDLQAQFGSNKGRDFVDDDQDPMPESRSEEYHGTHVAGITAATRNNDEGVAGISDANLISCRALGTRGGATSDIAEAVEYATNQGADIINMSLGGGGFSQTMKNAVQYAVNNGALPICAAGNSGNRGVSYPAKYDECVAVGAVNDSEDLASFSQYGPDLDIVAPGVDVLSTWTEVGTPYNRISGTSMACPAASGVAALGVSGAGSATELRSNLKSTARDIGLSEDRQGAGHVDAAAIVDGGDDDDDDPTPPDNEAPTVSASASSATVEVGTEVTFDGSASDSDGNVTSYEWSFGDGSSASGQTVTHTYSDAGDYTATLTVTDDDGATSSDSVAITVESGGGGGGTCGDTTETASASGYLYGYYDSSAFTYSVALSDPCQVSIGLSGDAYTDFDLYVTYDGRTPTTSDYDARSVTADSNEVILLEGVDPGQELGILVDSYSGSGSFEIAVEETGK